MKKVIACLLAAILVIGSLAACGSGESSTSKESVAEESTTSVQEAVIQESASQNIDALDQATERYPELNYAVNSFPTTLAPWQPTGNGTFIAMAYECLMVYDDTVGDYIMNIGEEWNKKDDLHWEMKIKENVYDTDGNNLTASDVVFCYNKLVESGNAAKFAAFDSIKVVDDYTVEFTWTTAIDRVGLLDKIVGTTYLYTEKAYNDHNELVTECCGTGSYKMTDYVSGSKIVLEAKDDYWAKDDPASPNGYTNVQTVNIVAVLEAAQNSIALQTGEIDFTESIPSDQLSLFTEGGEYSDEYNVMITANTDQAYFSPNRSSNAPNASITNDVNFALACFYALDNEAIADAAQNAIPATSCDGSYGKSAHPDHVDAWDEEENYVTVYDPDLAAEYLAKTSYKGETLSILVTSDEAQKNACVMIQALLGNIGINVEINALESQLFNTERKNESGWDFIFGTYGGPRWVDAINKICNYNESGNDMTYNFVHDETLQEKFETARGLDTWDDEHTTDLYHYILENAYYDFLYVKAKTVIYTKDIVEAFYEIPTGIYLRPQGCVYKLD